MINDVATLLAEYSRLPEYSEMELGHVETTSLFGNQPINIAATRGVISEVETLLSAGVNINNRGEHGYMPLHNAVEQDHLELVKFLVARGADRNGRTDDNVTPIELSVMLQREQITAFLNSLPT